MKTVPAVTPVTTPVAGSTVPTEGLLLLHAPVPVLLVTVIWEASHTAVGPPITAGSGFTVNASVI